MQAPARGGYHSHRELRTSNTSATRTALAAAKVSQFAGTRGSRTNAATARAAATIGASAETTSELSRNGPAPGMFLTSSEEKRSRRNSNQTADQIARQKSEAVRKDPLAKR